MMMRGADVEDGKDNDGDQDNGEGILHQDDGNLVPGVDVKDGKDNDGDGEGILDNNPQTWCLALMLPPPW